MLQLWAEEVLSRVAERKRRQKARSDLISRW
jgi:hypothetical protein